MNSEKKFSLKSILIVIGAIFAVVFGLSLLAGILHLVLHIILLIILLGIIACVGYTFFKLLTWLLDK